MNLDEQSIRKQWLIAFIVWTVWGCIGLILGVSVLTHNVPPAFPFGKTGVMILYSIAIPLSIATWWATYRYCYQKPGTGWLLLLLVSFVYGAILPPFGWLKGIPPALDIGAYSRIWEVIQWVVVLYVGFISYRLYKVNVAKTDAIAAKTTDAFNSWSEQLATKPRAELTIREKLVVGKDTVRRNWFVAFGFITLAALSGILPLLYQMVWYAPKDFQPEAMYQGLLTWLMMALGLLWGSWFFPYERRGTKWLIFLLVLSVAGELSLIAHASAGGISLVLLLVALLVLTYVQGALLCWFLVNKARQRF